MSATKRKSSAVVTDPRVQEIIKRARQLRDFGLNWVQLNNAILGPAGEVIKLFANRDERQHFLQSAAVAELHEVLASAPLPEEVEKAQETSGRILVRVPKSLHTALIDEAKEEGTSLNQLIVSKLSMPLKTMI